MPPDEGAEASGPQVVRGRIAGLVKGGFEVETADGPGFCSLAQIDSRRVNDASSFLQKEFDFAVTGRDDSGRLKLSRRKILEREARSRTADVRRQIVPDAVLKGRVARLTDFGAFLDLGGVEGMVHVSEVSHRRIEKPEEVLDVGQEVEARVLRVGKVRGGKGKGRGPGRISLSIKAAQEDPWTRVAEAFKPWHVADGRIVRVTEFGAFVELAPGIEGLMHASELPKGALAKLEEASKGGALMAVLVLDVEPSRRRIALAPAPGGLAAGERVEPLPLKVGKNVTGRVEEIQPGAILLRLGPGQQGMVPNPEMGTPRGADHRAEFPVGTEIEAEILRVESGGRRARLSRKRAQRKEERQEIARHAERESIPSLSTFGDLLKQARGEKES